MDNIELEQFGAELPDAVLQHAAPDSLTVSTQRTYYSPQTIVPATQQTFEMSYLTSEPASVEPSIMELQRIAGCLPNDTWKPLGRALGLLEVDLNTTAADHFHDPVEQCYQMQLLWRSRAEEPTWAKLAEALHSVGCPHLAGGHQTVDSDSGVLMCGRYIYFIVSVWLGSVLKVYSCNYTSGSQIDQCQG